MVLPQSGRELRDVSGRELSDALEHIDQPGVGVDVVQVARGEQALDDADLFCWTELGAKHVGILQSLLTTCRLHNVDPYDYLVDVLQRIDQHPATNVEQLTPRLWKEHFGEQPLRSDLHQLGMGRETPLS